MKCGQVYDMTLAFIAESVKSGDTSDLKARFVPILNAFCSMYEEASRAFTGDFADFAPVSDIDDFFPLDERFAYPCAFYAGALFLGDENPAHSSFLLSQSRALIDAVIKDTRAVSEKIIDKYS